MLRHLPVIGALLAVSAAVPAADTQGIYKWTDDQGEVHYTQFPPPGHSAEKLHAVPPPASPPQVLDKDLQQQMQTMQQQKKEQQQGARDAKEWAEIQKIRRQNCDTANKNLVSLQRGSNVRYVDTDGKVKHLTEEERNKRIDEANKQIKEYCNP
jgi:hypothetical protein